MSKNKTKRIQVPILARVEGEGALELLIRHRKIESLQLKIYEPPRLFEKFLEGRSYQEVLDIVARICGICPVAYQMSAVHALEQCFVIEPSPWVREMRRLFYCGEWLESHNLHIHFLALPDFLGFNSAPEMAKTYPEEVRRGLRLQALGNELICLFGGRSVNPVGACISGFYQAPTLKQSKKLLAKVQARINDCEDLIRWLCTLDLADNSHDFTSVSLQHPTEYPMNEGRLVSDKGLAITTDAFADFFKEFQVPYSNALHCLLEGKSYLVGPLARLNNNFGHLPSPIKALLKELGLLFPSRNMLQSIIARSIEIYFSVLEAQRILESYHYPETSYQAIQPRPGIGYGCTEAPRGILWQSYETDEEGLVKKARIVPPTSQNQARIEEDLRISLTKFGLDKSCEELRAYSEMLIRNYDPCISCSTHFLSLRMQEND